MKKIAGVIVVVASVFLIAIAPADARGRAGGGVRGGGVHHGFVRGGGVHHGFVRGGGVHHGFVRGGGVHHGFVGHHGFHPGFRGRVFIGPGVWLGPGWGPYWYPPYDPYYPPAYTTPAVVEPPTYVEQEPAATSYWYYCESARGYYPYVQQCPSGWLTVVPPTTTEPKP